MDFYVYVYKYMHNLFLSTLIAMDTYTYKCHIL